MINKHNSVCFVVPNAYPLIAGLDDEQIIGGAELQAWTIAKGLANEGFIVTFIVIAPENGEVLEYVSGVHIIPCYTRGKGIKGLRYIYPRWTGVWHALHISNADFYYQRTAGVVTGIVGLFCKLNKKRFMYGVAHDTDLIKGEELIPYLRDKFIYRLGLKLADKVAVQTESQRKLARDYGLRNASVFPNVYDEGNIRKVDSTEFNVLWVSTIREFKNPRKFLILAKSLPFIKFIMIGGKGASSKDLSLYEEVEKESEGIKNLVFLGFLPLEETEKFFDKANVFVNTSLHEGFPNTFLQSWSRAIPTMSLINFDLKKDRQCFHLNAKCIEDLINHIKLLHDNSGLRKSYGIEAKRYYKNHHAFDIILNKYIETIEE